MPILALNGCYPAGPQYEHRGDIRVVIIATEDSCYHYANYAIRIDSLGLGLGLPQYFLTEGGEHTVQVQCPAGGGKRIRYWRRTIHVTTDTTLRFPCDTCFVD